MQVLCREWGGSWQIYTMLQANECDSNNFLSSIYTQKKNVIKLKQGRFFDIKDIILMIFNIKDVSNVIWGKKG